MSEWLLHHGNDIVSERCDSDQSNTLAQRFWIFFSGRVCYTDMGSERLHLVVVPDDELAHSGYISEDTTIRFKAPIAHTCTKTLDMPNYQNQDELNLNFNILFNKSEEFVKRFGRA